MAAASAEETGALETKAEELEAVSDLVPLCFLRGSDLCGIKEFGEFVESAFFSERSAMDAAWANAMRETSLKAQLREFLFALAELYALHLKSAFGRLATFSRADANWLHYAGIMTRLLMAAGPMDDLESVRKGVKQFGVWQANAERHHKELCALAWDKRSFVPLSAEFKKYFAAHRTEVDANALWKRVVDPKQELWMTKYKKKPNVDAFRFLAAELPLAAMKYWHCGARALVTPMSVAVDIKCPPLVSFIDAYLRDSTATRVAQRSSESDALAKSTLRRLRHECGTKEAFKRTMQCIVQTVIKQIKASVAFSPDLFAMCDWWQRDETGSPRSSVMAALLLKAQNILDCKTVANATVQWQFAQHFLLDASTCLPALLKEAAANRIDGICNGTLLEESKKLVAEMELCAKKHEEAYKQLCDGCALKSTPETERWKWRQDSWFFAEGLNQPKAAETALEDLSTAAFNAKAKYDVSSYLNERLTDAHALDGRWKDAVKGLQKMHSVLRNAVLQFGAVKGAERCRAKAAEDKKSKWPKTAAVIDLLRCSLTFEDVFEFVAAVKLFKGDICSWNATDEAKTGDGVADSGLLPLELVRIKNGFDKLDGANMEVPNCFCDVKLNVAIRGVVSGEKHAVIGEVQFLLRPILESKKASHKIYEIQRNGSGLLADARKALATRFSDPMDIVVSAKTSEEMTRALFHHSDSARFDERTAVVALMHATALVSGSPLSLLRFVAEKLDKVRVEVVGDASVELFPAAMLQRVVGQRATDGKLAKCLLAIRKLVGDAPFDERLQAEVCPMEAYVSHCPGELLSDKTLRVLTPSLPSPKAASEFWKLAKCGCKGLQKAAMCGNVAVVKELLRLGVDAKERDSDGTSAVYWAAFYGHLEATELLLQNGVDVDAMRESGGTPLYVAAEKGFVDVVNVLIAGGANPSKAMDNGSTPLFVASQNNLVEVVSALISGGANPNAAKSDGWTPLLIAAFKGHSEVVKVLIEGGVDVGIKKDGWSALAFAKGGGHEAVVSLLK